MRRVPVLAVAIALLAAGVAYADETITARSPNSFSQAVTTIDQGERVTLRNVDIAGHDVSSQARGDDGRRLFASGLVAPGRSGPVEGTEHLTTGTYPFVCSVHPGMEATLEVTSAGTPVPRPADTRGPKLGIEVTSGKLAKVASKGKLGLRLRTDEAADVDLVARAKANGRRVKLGEASVSMSRPGSRGLAIALSKKARRALGRAGSAKVTVTASGRDTVGNTGASSASRTLR